MTAPSEKSRELRFAATLSGVITLRMLGLFLILPVFMILASDMPGYTPQAAGLAVGIYGLTQAALQQPFGWLSDRWGRKPVLLLGLALFAVGGVVAALADSMHMLIAGRALQGCGAIAGVAMAFAADLTRPERRPVIMAIIGIGIGAAFLLSMGLSVPLATILGLQGMFWLTVVFAIAGMGLVLTIPRQALPQEEPELEQQEFSMLPVWLLSVSVFLLHAVMTLLFVSLPPMLVGDFGYGLALHWKIYVPAMIGAVIFMLPILRRVGSNLSEQRMLPWAFVVLALAVAVLPVSANLAALGAVLAVYFLGFNLLEAAMPSLLSRITGSRGRGRRLGIYSTFQFLGAFAGGVAGGWLLGRFGSQAALVAAGSVSLLWAIVLKVSAKGVFPTGGNP
ncbi:MAG: MFS transporter [Xanthomonadales bacterium]|nr:MFS transporter [Gammaproteobacteria bacterium]MBT8054675.1 MFS transporter [Gammaproteobacteria bacterium]NND55765.1 MFS transporter [Xanthomonadales bacterium]NNK50176.1 MFS transporter [Xanthomonadales bacterium]